ncbi:MULTISPECIES: DUF6571 family protein [unclassified Actinomyces]|uniref:DUF6571 family protein n=1 Tax=unclassified Actinomyces TaxID=2609248 RepID=UPI0013A6C1AB|nr:MULTISPECIES: DUF6571 family protein [unclassified Actinomyces]NDR53250.1 hypothetical protein [Actinomyces sp. 565]
MTEVEEGSDGVFYCSIEGERAVLAAHGTADSWVAFGRGGNNAFTTLEAIAGGEGREVPGADARVFSYLGRYPKHPNAYAYWLEGRAGFAMYTVVAEDADESTVAALEELVIKYAPQVLDGVASRTADPGRNRDDPATGTPSPEPSASATAATTASVTAGTEGSDRARSDAEKAKNAKPDELLELINGLLADHKDDGVYAAAFADAMGPEGMMELAYTINQQRQQQTENLPAYDPNDPDAEYVTRWQQTEDAWLSAQATLSICLGTATNSSAWTPQHRTDYAKILSELLADESQSYYMPLGFNLLLAGADRSVMNLVEVDGGVVQAGGEFDKYFLLDLGHALQAYEQTDSDLPVWQLQRMKTSSPEGGVGDWDPMAGILTAMGRQPDAALDLLAPPVDDRAIEQTVEVDGTTWEWLRGRDWDSTSFEALTAAVAGASEHRQLTTGTKDERAAWITEHAVVDMAGRKGSLWTDTSRQNAAVVLANSMEEIDETATDSDNSVKFSRFEAGLPAGWRGYRDDEITVLLREILKDDIALQAVSEAAGRYTSLRLDDALDTLPADSDDSEDSGYSSLKAASALIVQKLEPDGRLLGYIQGAAEKGRDDDGEQLDATNQMLLDAFDDGVYSTAATVAGAAGPAWGGTARNIAQSYLVAALQKPVAGASGWSDVQDYGMSEAVRRHFLVEAYVKLDERGLLPAGVYEGVEDKAYTGFDAWMKRDAAGNSYLDAAALLSDPDHMGQFVGWLTDDPDLAGVNLRDGVPAVKAFEAGHDAGGA